MRSHLQQTSQRAKVKRLVETDIKKKKNTRIYNTAHMTKSNNQACSYCKHNEEAIRNLETQNQATLAFLCSQAALFVLRDSA